MVMCAIYGCSANNRNKKYKNVNFFTFPREKDIRQKWIHACGRIDNFNVENARICSLHFAESDCRVLQGVLNKRVLKAKVIPSKKLPKEIIRLNGLNWKQRRWVKKIPTFAIRRLLSRVQNKTEESTETQSYIPVPTCNSPSSQGNQSGTMSGTTETECATALRSPPMRIATSQSSSSQGKISLVPANFLLKPPQQQIQLRPQQHILYAKPSVQNTSGLQTSGPGKMPMKVLLVNTVQKNHSAVSTTTATDTSIMSVASSSPMKTNVGICSKTSLPTKDHSAHQSESGTATTTSNRGFRTLLHNLIKLQTENIELTKKRIEMEKERFEFEKSLADKILNLLSPAITQNKSTESEPSIPLLVPKVEKEDD